MSADVVIEAAGLGKRYWLRGGGRPADTLREHIAAVVRRALGRRAPDEELWALRDASFEVRRGEVLGVLGGNGAGKSSLLKVLARITRPTTGRALVRGRLGSLLEVGTGFHPELTGRENVFLSGTILGMRRREVAASFDAIVAFAEVERFVDTPVKFYSSGMTVRLGFAVAAHLRTDVLLVDEVLAVGDAAFQRKCLGSMQGAAGDGRTVLFVSHDMRAVSRLCTRALLFERGRLAADGPVAPIVERYLTQGGALVGDGDVPSTVWRPCGTREALLRRAQLLDPEGLPVREVFLGEGLRLRLFFDVDRPVTDAALEVGISTADGVRVVTATNVARGGAPLELEPGARRIDVELDVTLLPGQYALDVFVHHVTTSSVTIDWVERALTFTALDVSRDGADRHADFGARSVRGYVRAPARFGSPTAEH